MSVDLNHGLDLGDVGAGLMLGTPAAAVIATDASNASSQQSGSRLRMEVVATLRAELQRDDLTSEERTDILDRLERTVASEDAKDTESKRWSAVQANRLALMVVVMAVAACIGKFAPSR